MLNEIVRELGTYLASKGVPYPVVHGPGSGAVEARLVTSITRGRIVIERNRKGREAFKAPPTPQRLQIGTSKTTVPLAQELQVLVRVFAQSTLIGAALHDHEEECDRVVRHVAIGLRHVVIARKHRPPEFTGHMLTADELKSVDTEQWAGVAYELEFSIERGLFESDWLGAGKPLGTVAQVAHTGCAGD